MKTTAFTQYGWRITGSLLLAAALTAGCSAPAGPAPAATETEQGAVKVETIAKRSMGNPREQVASVNAIVQLEVMAKAEGKVWNVLKKNGDLVKEGDVIIRLDDKDALSQKEKAETSMRSAQQSLSKSADDFNSGKTDMENSVAKIEQQVKELEKDYNKARNDFDAGAITKRQLEQTETQVTNARRDLDAARQKLVTLNKSSSLAALQAQVDAARLSVQDANRALEEYDVKAPASGVLTDMNVTVGMTMPRGGKIGVVQQTERVKIKTDLSEATAKLAAGKPELVVYSSDNPGKQIKAKVTYLANLPDAATKLYPLELEADNADGYLKPGTRVQVQLTTPEEETVVAVPTLSIVREGGDAFLYVLKGDQAEKRKVKLGRLNGSFQEVLDGVKPDEKLIVSGQHRLKDGQKVEVKTP
ncbi:efflux RND transporter periplasmic adaptor subunit [Paenibacillus hodogayensis]|uniref:Efflux RND transporter periplasmic adaptor subunit n=1 Tax=Paenibacillus hodogayensis TaxID=279208 RepID=A0ABV5VU59_9BACL